MNQHELTPQERERALELVNAMLEAEDLARVKVNHPLQFMLLMMDLAGVPNVNAYVLPTWRPETQVVRLELRRKATQVERLPPPSPVFRPDRTRSAFDTIPTSSFDKAVVVEDIPFDLPLAHGFNHAFEHRLLPATKAFLGTGAWHLVHVISQKQAWERLKSLRGDFTNGDPWA